MHSSPPLSDQGRQARDEAYKLKMEKLNDFSVEHPTMFHRLNSVKLAEAPASGFERSLADQLFNRGTLTDRQVAAWYRGQEQREQWRPARASDDRIPVDLTPIHEMFSTARANLKRPVYRAEEVLLSPAPSYGANAGAIYVKGSDGEYFGKVVGTEFRPVMALQGQRLANLVYLLIRISRDPKEVAVAYGRKTGTCACCGRPLSDPKSVALGIGPICISNWGFSVPERKDI